MATFPLYADRQLQRGIQTTVNISHTATVAPWEGVRLESGRQEFEPRTPRGALSRWSHACDFRIATLVARVSALGLNGTVLYG